MQLGPYELFEQIGAGGMGEVYRARDTVLKREVAVKILPEAFAADPGRMARFQREAEVLASLNHPNIAHIYGIEQRALVMELVPGPTLADRIRAGAIPEDEALAIAKQICEALEYAHEKGIVHRDLKPANIKVTPGGVVKVLDFGLAKATQAEAYAAGDSPTLTLGATQAGVILGTAAYMSPEQARGKDVDKRADIWAFGVVLYEMLTGKNLYAGEMVSDILAAVIAKDPEIGPLPARWRPVIEKCLRKDPRMRWRDIGDVRIAMEEPPPSLAGLAGLERSRFSWIGWVVAAVVALGLGYVGYRHYTEESRVLRMSVLVPEKAAYSQNQIPAISPDGRRIVFGATLSDKTMLWVRDLDALAARPLTGTDDAIFPFWSPDSRSVAFFAGTKLKRIEVAGGPALTICDVTQGRGGTWGTSDVIVYGVNNGGLFRVAAAGGAPVPLTTPDRSAETSHRFPWFLPDGKHFLYTARSQGEAEKTRINVADIDTRPESNSRRLAVAADSNGVYAAPGYILYTRERTLMAQPYDAGKMQTSGDAVPIAEQVDYIAGLSHSRFSVSQNGVLVYTSGVVAAGGVTQLTWFDRSGKPTGTLGAPGLIEWPSISPDGNMVAFDRREGTGTSDVWLRDLVRGTESRFTFGPGSSSYPVWSPDGSHIAFAASRDGTGNVYQRATGGVSQDEPLDKDGSRRKRPRDWSRDGKYIVEDSGTGQGGVWVLPMSGDKKPFAFIHTEFNETAARISPDGQWLAYVSNESRRNEIYVSTFPNPGGKWQVSTGGGGEPAWSRDGRELFYISGNKIMAVPVRPGSKFDPGTPKELFETRVNSRFDVSKDGRFLMAVPVEQPGGATPPITVVMNWAAGLKK